MYKNKRYRINTLLLALCMLCSGLSMTICVSCSEDEEEISSSKTTLLSYGPMPIARGAELRFIGENLDQINSIVLPSSLEISSSDFIEQTGESIKLIVPQNATEGYVELLGSGISITTKTLMTYSEPIDIDGSFSPATVKAGDVLTIEGDYLNLVAEVILSDRVPVDSSLFISQSRKEITLKVPATAQSGKIAVSNGAEDPIIVYSEKELNVIVSGLSSVSPNPVKPGEMVTITGDDLDLVTSITLGGGINISDFTLSDDKKSITAKVPMNTQDGNVELNFASGLTVASADVLIMVVPSVSIANVTVKNGGSLSVTGTNLDLIDEVIFSDGALGTISDGRTATTMSVEIPAEAISGEVVFNTTSEKSVSGGNLVLIDPVFTALAPQESKPNVDIVISGSNLDLVASVVFAGGVEGTIVNQSETEITVTVPVGSVTGAVTLVAINATEVTSSSDFTVLQNLPTITSYSEDTGTPGQILTINGESLLLIKELIFPGDLYATAYGSKSDTQIQVYVPKDVESGVGTIKMITYEGEEGFLPELFIGGTDPITDQTVMICNFNGGGATQSTWGSAITFGQPEVYFDGSDALIGKVSSGWQWGWANNWDYRPSLDNAGNYVLKFDICITKTVDDVNLSMRLKDENTVVDLGNPFTETTGGTWITMSFDVLTSDMNIDGNGDWGLIFQGGSYDLTGIMIDNLRFDPK